MNVPDPPKIPAEEAAREAERRMIAGCLEGRPGAFQELVDSFRGRLIRTAYGIVRNVEDAKDLAQEAFLRAFQALDRFDTSRPLAPWLLTIVSRLAIDKVRKAKRFRNIQPEVSQRMDDRPAAAPDAGLQKGEAQVYLAAAFEQLDGRARSVLTLKEVEGLSNDEVAEILGIKASTVRVHLFKTRQKLRKLMEEAGYRHKPSPDTVNEPEDGT